MTKEQILELVKECMVASFELDPSEIHPTAHLIDDLDLDSIDAIDMAVDLEERTGLDVTGEELMEIRVIQDIVDLVHRKLGTA